MKDKNIIYSKYFPKPKYKTVIKTVLFQGKLIKYYGTVINK